MTITLTNLRDLKRTGKSILDWRYQGVVDVTTTTGILWWKRQSTEVRPVAKESIGFWFFLDTGGLTPEFQMETLARAEFFRLGW